MRMTFKLIIIGGLAVFISVVVAVVVVPGLIWNPPRTVIAHAYTSLQEQGRTLFYSNGCNYCHTQYVRAEDTAMGPISQGGNYVFDSPMTLGSERTGPDLSYVGRKRSERWEIEHLKDPRAYSPLSIMPSFAFLSQQQLEAVAAYLFALGDRTAAQRMILPPDVYANVTSPLTCPPTQTGGDPPDGWDAWDACGLQEGKELYVDRCLTCHGCAGNGLGSYAGTMSVTPADYKQEPFRSMPDEQWFWHVSEGLPGTLMPTWKASLSTDQIWKVIRYVQRVYARPFMHDPNEGDPSGAYANLTNPVPQTLEALDEGKAIFIRECMVCHGDAGRGQGPYRQVLQPGPPDFGDGSYGDYTDADYFWRISEGVPWTAMPSWKLRYSEEQRWKLVHHIRTFFTQTTSRPPAPPEDEDFTYPDFYREDMRFPEDVSFDRGRVLYLQQCAHCHGVAGDGMGWDGLYLNPPPADFRDMAGKPMTPEAQGEHMAKVTFGIQDTAMPSWGEWLPESQRWDVIKYLMQAFMVGTSTTTSAYSRAEVATEFALVSSEVYLAEGHTISTTHGAELYGQYCASCHGDTGGGDGPGTVGNASPAPATFAKDMSEPYVFWRIWEGVPDSVMYPFGSAITDADIWDITAYIMGWGASGAANK